MNSADRTLQATAREFSYQQNEGETLNYILNYAPVLETASISTSTWDGTGLSFSGSAISGNTTHTKIAASNGHYVAKNTITTSAGETLVRVIKLHVTQTPKASIEGDYEG